MSCGRHHWTEVGHVGPTVSVECVECGAVAVIDEHGALLAGPFTQAPLFARARNEQLAFALVGA
jgi:hypothetical protein